MQRIMIVVGARPNFMKAAPILRAMQQSPDMKGMLIHTGQHYDYNMSDVFFSDLNLSKPDEFLGVGSGSHAQQTARIMLSFEEVVCRYRPDMVMVVGDVNSTLACALVAVKLGIAVAHVEAGLRSYDRQMPEEINRLATDAISDILFTPSRDASDNLMREGVDPQRVHFVGNVMIDTLLYSRRLAHEKSNILCNLGVKEHEYALVTIHRPSNVDSEDNLKSMMDIVLHAQTHLPTVFPVHPRTRHMLDIQGWLRQIEDRGVLLCEPVGYLDFIRLMDSARMVMTDSGGIQEETTALGVPCLTLRDTTERPITISEGTNRLAGTTPDRVFPMIEEVLRKPVCQPARLPEGWDGCAALRIVEVLRRKVNNRQ